MFAALQGFWKKKAVISKQHLVKKLSQPLLDQYFISYPSHLEMVLKLSFLELSKNFAAQEILFLKARKKTEVFNNIFEIFDNYNTIKSKATLKGNNPQQLNQVIQYKSALKHCSQVKDLYDLSRGRINVASESQIESTIEAMINQSKAFSHRLVYKLLPKSPVSEIDKKMPFSKKFFAYFRIHLFFEDQEGYIFECQIGTQATTDLYEIEGIRIPNFFFSKKDSLSQYLIKYPKNLHTIFYKYLLNLDSSIQYKIAKRINFQAFIHKINRMAEKSNSLGAQYIDFDKDIYNLHKQATKILLHIDDVKRPHVMAK